MPYLGNEPAVAYTSTTKDSFSGDGSTTDFTMSKSANVNAVRVVVENVVQNPTVAYTCSGTTLSFTSAPPTGTSNIYVVHLGPPAATVAPPTTINNSTTFGDGADIITATAGTSNVRVGVNAGNSIASGGNYNTVVGDEAGTAISTGDVNTFVGYQSGDATTTSGNNVGVGYASLTTNILSSKNVAIGNNALKTHNLGSAGEGLNVAIGHGAGEEITTGLSNTLIGGQAGDALTVAYYNVAVGEGALSADVQGSRSVAVGWNALNDQSFGSATESYNTAVGFEAGCKITSGANNTFVGSLAGDALTTSNSNTAIGKSALSAETSSNGNTAVGEGALQTQNVGGSGDARNTAVGLLAGSEITSGHSNTCIGYLAGDDLTTGTQNVFVGYDATSASSSDGNQIVMGYVVDSIGGNYFTFGNNSIGRVYNQFSSNASWTRTSDERIKKDIEANTDLGLDFINDLRTVTYKWKAPSEHPEEFKSYNAEQTEAAYTEKMYGFIAQEVKAAMDTHNITGFNGWHVTSESQGSQQGVSYEMFVMPLVKAIQELSAKNDALETENTAIKARLDALEAG